ncbi:hypothetical protein MAR_025061 [Mya arenaria]|uniref:B box-type domain-containing protein n=1 Tax=Mya arenaria TaxID=6604 RepID=A0ABY7DUW7_MYAAR|nr:uncharacterized protein LOC128229399 [Mya arenaria]WAR00689.1 hypothetical protein MAR_025061 [Mya arenaria]
MDSLNSLRGSVLDPGYHCSACRDKGHKIEACVYCSMCVKHYCLECTTLHGELFPNHTVSGNEHGRTPRGPQKKGGATKCEKHGGQQLTMYCASHDNVCCPLCADGEHRLCRDVQPISGISESVHRRADVKHLAMVIEKLANRVAHLSDDRKKAHKTLKDSYKDIVSEIRQTREHLNRVLARLEKQTVEELDVLYKDVSSKIQHDIDVCERKNHSLKKQLEELHTRRAGDETITRLVQTESEEKIAEAEQLLGKLENQDFTLKFRPDHSVDEFLSGLHVIGKIEQPYSAETSGLSAMLEMGLSLTPRRLPSPPHHMYHVQFLENHNVQVRGDVDICYITGCCQLPNGDIIIVDCSNGRIKLLNNTFHVLAHCAIPDFAQDACCITNNEVAVTVNNSRENIHEIQFIGIANNQLHLTRKIKLTHDCDGIAHHADHLYVSSWDALYSYTTSGRFVGKLYQETSENDTTVYRIAVSDDGTRIYVTNVDSDSLVTLDHNGYVLATLTDADLRKPSGVCVASGGQVFVAGEMSNTIIQVDREGERKLGTVAGHLEGLKVPQALCFDRHSVALIASQDKSDNLIVMHMK